MNPYRRLLAPTDFSEVSNAALEHAIILAETFQATIHLLHVVEDPLSTTLVSDSYALPDNFLEQLENRAQQRLKGLLPDTKLRSLDAQFVVREGSPFVEIVRYAKENAIDLIVMGTHGRGPIAHMLLGSVAEQVLRKAPCPVLVVRIANQQFVMP